MVHVGSHIVECICVEFTSHLRRIYVGLTSDLRRIVNLHVDLRRIYIGFTSDLRWIHVGFT